MFIQQFGFFYPVRLFSHMVWLLFLKRCLATLESCGATACEVIAKYWCVLSAMGVSKESISKFY